MKRSFAMFLAVTLIQFFIVSQNFAGACASRSQVYVYSDLMDAAMDGKISEVKRLINAGAKIDGDDRGNGKPLHYAAWQGHQDIVSVLLTFGANVNATDSKNETPLHWAIKNGHYDTIQALIASGADVNAPNEKGRTPLQIAMKKWPRLAPSLQPAAIAQFHTQTALVHADAGNHELAARSHTWAAQALPGTPEAMTSHALAAESFIAAGNHAAAGKSYTAIGNHFAAAQSYFAAREFLSGSQSYSAAFKSLITRELTAVERLAAITQAKIAVVHLESAAVTVDSELEVAILEGGDQAPAVAVLRANSTQIHKMIDEVHDVEAVIYAIKLES